MESMYCYVLFVSKCVFEVKAKHYEYIQIFLSTPKLAHCNLSQIRRAHWEPCIIKGFGNLKWTSPGKLKHISVISVPLGLWEVLGQISAFVLHQAQPHSFFPNCAFSFAFIRIANYAALRTAFSFVLLNIGT